MEEDRTAWIDQARRALTFIVPHKSTVAVITLMAVGSAALGALEPLAMKYIFDKLGKKALDALLIGVMMLVSVGLMKEVIGGLSNWLVWSIRLKVNAGLLEATVERLHSLPVTYHREETVGGIMTKLDRGINGFVGALAELSFNTFPGIIYLVISLFIMIKLDWRLSVLVLVFAPLPALIGMLAADRQTARDRCLMERWTGIFSRFNEVLSGIITVKSFTMEESEKRRFMDGVEGANEMVIKGVGFDTGIEAAKNTIAMLARVGALGAGGYLVLKGEITSGTLVAFIGYAGGLFGPVQGLTGIYQSMRRATVSLDIIFSILDAQDTIPDEPGAKDLGHVRGEVVFSDVAFGYRRERPIINSINMHVRPGEVVALIGPSGAGKTTLMSLLQRFYEPDGGIIRLDGEDIRRFKQRSLRSNIGVVAQDAIIFNDTVRNNIAYGRPDASKKEIEEAAKAANAHGFISELPEGYDTVVGERGSKLSAGERQRISIARALIKDTPILILDEATSALDAQSEALVQDALNKLMRGRTTFIIAHRLSTVINADRILVLKDGSIVEAGGHEELLKKEGYYASLVACQTRGLSVDAA